MSEGGLKVAELFAALSLRPDEKSFEAADKLLEAVHHGLEAYLSFEGIEKLHEMVDKTMEVASAAVDAGQRIGVTTEAIQELGYAADTSGASSEELQMGLQHLAAGLQEAHKGTGPAVDAFRRLGVSMSEVRGKSPDEVLMVLADHFARLPDGMVKATAAQELFGRGGARLIPLLDKGAEGIAEVRKEARELGVVIDDKTAHSFKDLEDAQTRVKASLTGLRNEAAIAVLPVITEMADGLFQWVKANREAIASGLKASLQALVFVFKTAAAAVSALVKGFQFLRGHLEYAIGAFAGLVFAMRAVITEAASSALEFAASWGAAFAEFAVFAAAVAAAVTALKWLYDEIESGKGLEQIWDDVVDGMRKAWAEFLPWAETAYRKMLEGLQIAGQKFVDYVNGQQKAGAEDGNYTKDASFFDRALHPIKNYSSFVANQDMHQRDVDAAQQSADEAASAEAEYHFRRAFGGAAAPATPPAQTVTNTFGGITINVPPGTDEAAAVRMINNVIQSHILDAHASTGARGAR